jgi:hypothetical protein
MEIKIVCACGTKFKFEVEPVHARMPMPVNCPGCGANATAQANAIIEANLAGVPGQPPARPVTTVPVGLRISPPAAPPPVPVAAPAGGAVPPPPPPPMRPRPVPPQKKEPNGVVKMLLGLLVFALVGYGTYRFVTRWAKRIDFVTKVATAVSDASVDKGESDGGAKNLWYEKCAMLFVQHSNHLEVAKACQDYWKTKLHKNLLLIDSEGDFMNPGEYELIPAHNGYVRLIGAHEWPVPAHEGLAQHLSQTFGGRVFEWRSESFADTYHFGVYDAGVRKFHAQMDIKFTGDDAKEIVTTEGNEFAIANGFKPGPEGFKDFHVLEADKITQKLGLKIWDEKEGTEVKVMTLKENPPPARSANN